MPVKSKVEISQKFVAFSEYMNFSLKLYVADEPNLCGLLRISEPYHFKTVRPEIMLLVLRLSRLLLKSLTTLCAYGNFALHKIVPQYVLSPSAYVHPYEVCHRRRRAATVVRSCVVDASQKAKIAEKVHKPPFGGQCHQF